jgi:GR25 family glycosyltransferase involved in LPS biosynthesis
MYETFVLSLETDIDRREHTIKLLSDLNISFIFYNAKTSSDVTPEIKNKLFKDIDIYEWDINHDAVLATFLSHLNLLNYSYENKTNILVLEDDLIYNNEFDFKNVDFNKFDIFNLSYQMSCCAYFVNHTRIKNIINSFYNNKITQAFDWELFKRQRMFNIKTVHTPIFIQTNNFISNIAPNGYKKNTSC